MLQVAWGRYVFHFVFLPLYGGSAFARAIWSASGWTRMFATQASVAADRPFVAAARRHLVLFRRGALRAAGRGAAVAFLEPLLITALAHFFLNEQVGVRRWMAVSVGFIGVMVVVRPGFGMAHWGMLLSLGSAGCGSVYVILTRVVSRDDFGGDVAGLFRSCRRRRPEPG